MKQLIEYFNESMLADDDALDNRQLTYAPEDKKALKNYIYEYICKKGKSIKNGDTVDLNFIDTSKITDLSKLFSFNNLATRSRVSLSKLNFDVSDWDVSNVTNLNETFSNLENFNCDLSKWDVRKVAKMNHTFTRCFKFEGIGLDKWKTDNLNSLLSTFNSCTALTGKTVENFNVSKCTNFELCFCGCKNLKCDLSKWDMQKANNVSRMFFECQRKNVKLPKLNLEKFVKIMLFD